MKYITLIMIVLFISVIIKIIVNDYSCTKRGGVPVRSVCLKPEALIEVPK